MILDKIVFQSNPPSTTNVLWARPMNGCFVIYLFNNGIWQSLKIANDNNTTSVEDDTIASGNTSDIDTTTILQKIDSITGENDTTPELNTTKEIISFLEGYDNTKKLKDVVSGTVDENGIVHY